MTTNRGKRNVFALFFLFGFSTTGWIARFPEVKANLRLSNGEFGTVMSIGAIGSVISLLVVGHIVHRFGTTFVMLSASLAYCLLIGLMVHLTSVFIFSISLFLCGIAIGAFHISVNAQALHEQERIGEILVPKAAGLWSLGALLTLLISGLLTGHISLIWHIDLLEGLSFLAMLLLVKQMQPFSIQPNHSGTDESSIDKIFRNFHVNWPISIGMLMGIQLEFSSGDWATIYTKENLNFSAGLATIPYICFILAMIVGRLTIHKFRDHNPIEKLVRIGGIFGGSAFIIGLTLSHFLAKSHPLLAFLSICLGFLIGGFGSSFLGPIFLNAANRASDSPGGVVVGQLGVVNNILTFFVKAIIAWTAQWLSLSVALLIPGAMLIGVSLFSKVIAEQPSH
jgi:MFS family permease